MSTPAGAFRSMANSAHWASLISVRPPGWQCWRAWVRWRLVFIVGVGVIPCSCVGRVVLGCEVDGAGHDLRVCGQHLGGTGRACGEPALWWAVMA